MVRPGFTPEEQAGFRHGYSTSDNISSLQSIVQKYITKNEGRSIVSLYISLKHFTPLIVKYYFIVLSIKV